ncbi:unnamed protein product, partial [Ixodes hexagonus]
MLCGRRWAAKPWGPGGCAAGLLRCRCSAATAAQAATASPPATSRRRRQSSMAHCTARRHPAATKTTTTRVVHSTRWSTVSDIPRGGGGGALSLRRARLHPSRRVAARSTRAQRRPGAARGSATAAGVTLPRALLSQKRKREEEENERTGGACWRRSGELREKRLGMRRMRMETSGSQKSGNSRAVFS